MSLYNFSSVDPEHYNRIKTTIPNHFLTRYVNVCVSTFTSHCNIEVLNKNDYIEFEIVGEKHKVFCTDQYSKISVSNLPSLFEEWFKIADIKMKVSITNVDTVRFLSDVDFQITDMSYNMKLITGFYCLDETKWPIKSIEREILEERTEPEDIPLENIQIFLQKIRVGELRPVQKTLTPANANAYTIIYTVHDENIATIDENGYVKGVAEGGATVDYEVRSLDTPEYVAPEWSGTFTIDVERPQEDVPVENVKLQERIVVSEGKGKMIFPEISPIPAAYTEKWISNFPDIATVENGYVFGKKIGSGLITYIVEYKKNGQKMDIAKEVEVVVESATKQTVVKDIITSDTVGYFLSTPILYLLTNIGSHVFYNDIKNDKNIQCGMVCMCLNNSWSSSFPIIAQQGEIITKCALNNTSDVYFILVDANMREVKLLNPMYITVSIRPDEESLTTPGLLQ